MAHIPLYQPTRPSRRRLSLRQIVALLAGAAAPLAIAGSVLGYGINAPASAPAGSPITTFFQADPVTQLAQILGSRPPAAPAAPPRASVAAKPAVAPAIPPPPSPTPTVETQPILAQPPAPVKAPARPPAPPAPSAAPASPPTPAPSPSPSSVSVTIVHTTAGIGVLDHQRLRIQIPRLRAATVTRDTRGDTQAAQRRSARDEALRVADFSSSDDRELQRRARKRDG